MVVYVRARDPQPTAAMVNGGCVVDIKWVQSLIGNRFSSLARIGYRAMGGSFDADSTRSIGIFTPCLRWQDFYGKKLLLLSVVAGMLILFVTNSGSSRKSRNGHSMLSPDDRVEGIVR